jgi:hypothetical protein
MLHNFISDYDGMKSSLKYTIPFYHKKKNICYINPLKNGGAELVFWQALKMPNSLPMLEQKDRKWFAGITYNNLDAVDFEILDRMIKEALSVDLLPYKRN